MSLTFSAGVVDLDVLERPRAGVAEDGAVHGHLAARLAAAPANTHIRLLSKLRHSFEFSSGESSVGEVGRMEGSGSGAKWFRLLSRSHLCNERDRVRGNKLKAGCYPPPPLPVLLLHFIRQFHSSPVPSKHGSRRGRGPLNRARRWVRFHCNFSQTAFQIMASEGEGSLLQTVFARATLINFCVLSPLLHTNL